MFTCADFTSHPQKPVSNFKIDFFFYFFYKLSAVAKGDFTEKICRQVWGSICAYVKKTVKAISGIYNVGNAGVSEKGRLIYEIRRDVCLTQIELWELYKCGANSVDLYVRSFFD